MVAEESGGAFSWFGAPFHPPPFPHLVYFSGQFAYNCIRHRYPQKGEGKIEQISEFGKCRLSVYTQGTVRGQNRPD